MNVLFKLLRTAAVIAAVVLVKSATAAPAATCVGRVVNALPSGSTNLGSGTLIDVTEDGQRGLVLTCAHLFAEGRGKITVLLLGRGQHQVVKHGAVLVAIDREADLAALEITEPEIQPASVSLHVVEASRYTACGYGTTGQYACSPGRVLTPSSSANRMSMRVTGGVRSGDSGGGVFDLQGRLVGVIWGTTGGVTYASSGGPLRRFLQRALGQRYWRVLVAAPRTEVDQSRPPLSQAPLSQGCAAGRCPSPVSPNRPPRRLANPWQSVTPNSPVQPVGPTPPKWQTPWPEARQLPPAELPLREDQQNRPGGDHTPEDHTLNNHTQEDVGQGRWGKTLGGVAGRTAVGLLGLSGPAGWAVLAGSTVAGWWLGRTRNRRLQKQRRNRHRTFAQPLTAEATAAAEPGFLPTEPHEQETVTLAPVERDDREARQLLRLSQLEGRDPLQDALAGRLALDRLDEIAERELDSPQGSWADSLRRELRDRFNEVAPTRLSPTQFSPIDGPSSAA